MEAIFTQVIFICIYLLSIAWQWLCGLNDGIERRGGNVRGDGGQRQGCRRLPDLVDVARCQVGQTGRQRIRLGNVLERLRRCVDRPRDALKGITVGLADTHAINNRFNIEIKGLGGEESV